MPTRSVGLESERSLLSFKEGDGRLPFEIYRFRPSLLFGSQLLLFLFKAQILPILYLVDDLLHRMRNDSLPESSSLQRSKGLFTLWISIVCIHLVLPVHVLTVRVASWKERVCNLEIAFDISLRVLGTYLIQHLV